MGHQHLSNTEIGIYAPAVYTDHPVEGVSEKYTFVPTSRIIEDMRTLGWVPISASQQRSRRYDNRQFGRHLIRFRRQEQIYYVTEIIPEIGLYNGHDGKTLLKLFAGLFDTGSENALIIPDELFPAVKLIHRGYEFSQVEEMTKNYVASIPNIDDEILKYKGITLDVIAKRSFAMEASAIRWPKGQNMSLFFADNLLIPKSPGLAGDNLWTVFQCVMHNIVNGGVETGKLAKVVKMVNRPVTRKIRTRKMTSVSEYLRISRELWQLVMRIAGERVS